MFGIKSPRRARSMFSVSSFFGSPATTTSEAGPRAKSRAHRKCVLPDGACMTWAEKALPSLSAISLNRGSPVMLPRRSKFIMATELAEGIAESVIVFCLTSSSSPPLPVK